MAVRALKLDVFLADAVFGGKSNEYRYTLRREWDSRKLGLAFCMLNPSTADASTDDPTVAKCQTFARLWGYGSLLVVNLFAYRATSPMVLKRVDDPIGPCNDYYIRRAAEDYDMVCAWGNHGSIHGRSGKVMEILREVRRKNPLLLRALRVTKSGEPEHPLYIPFSTATVEY